MKALVTTRIGDIAFLIGLLLLYAYAGTFSFIELAENASWAKAMAAVGLLLPSALFIFGGIVISSFIIALIWGVLIGTYSSLYVASPILAFLGSDNREKKEN